MVLLRAKTYQRAGYTSYTLGPSDPDAKYQRAKFGHARKAKSRDSFGFKSDTAVLTFTFLFPSIPSFFTFLASFFFLLLGI